jgi:hypothetical protein
LTIRLATPDTGVAREVLMESLHTILAVGPGVAFQVWIGLLIWRSLAD